MGYNDRRYYSSFDSSEYRGLIMSWISITVRTPDDFEDAIITDGTEIERAQFRKMIPQTLPGQAYGLGKASKMSTGHLWVRKNDNGEPVYGLTNEVILWMEIPELPDTINQGEVNK